VHSRVRRTRTGDEHLEADVRTTAILRHQGQPRRHVPTHRIPGDRDPAAVDPDLGAVRGHPLGRGIALLELGGENRVGDGRIFDEDRGGARAILHMAKTDQLLRGGGFTAEQLHYSTETERNMNGRQWGRRGARDQDCSSKVTRSAGMADIIDAWMQLPNKAYLLDPMFDSLRRWPTAWKSTGAGQPGDHARRGARHFTRPRGHAGYRERLVGADRSDDHERRSGGRSPGPSTACRRRGVRRHQ
jgi:hypothetical protein